MDPIAVDIRLIRAVVGAELRIVPGRALMARVVSADVAGRGSLSIAGVVIDAKLPKGVQAGQELRLTVRDVSPERVVLGLSDQNLPVLAAAAPATPLPGGGTVQLHERDAGGSAGGSGAADRHSLALVYNAPALGPVDLRFELDSQTLHLSATFPAGEAVQQAEGAAGALRDALSDALGRPVSVEIAARREPLDLYA
jgi:hypothetical protein